MKRKTEALKENTRSSHDYTNSTNNDNDVFFSSSTFNNETVKNVKNDNLRVQNHVDYRDLPSPCFKNDFEEEEKSKNSKSAFNTKTFKSIEYDEELKQNISKIFLLAY